MCRWKGFENKTAVDLRIHTFADSAHSFVVEAIMKTSSIVLLRPPRLFLVNFVQAVQCHAPAYVLLLPTASKLEDISQDMGRR